ncbi:MAG: hypothetical protein PHC84_00290 [Clostridia bacterium]|nr:hypothetical protein [Clostridia bacterium]
MGLDKIIEYQSIDIKLYALENEFQRSDELKNLKILQNNYKEKTEELSRMMKETQELFSSFEKSGLRISEVDGLEEDLSRDINSINDLDELDLYDKSLLKYDESISSIERELNRTAKRFTEIKIEVQKLIEQRLEINKLYVQHKKYHDDKINDVKMKAAPIMRELQVLRESVDPKLLSKYEELRAARKMPAYVEYNDGNCSGCGMHIFIEVNAKLNNKGDTAECPECRRIVYKL